MGRRTTQFFAALERALLLPHVDRAMIEMQEPAAVGPIRRAIGVRLATQAKRPLIAGICGAQGSGKSTDCAFVARRLEADGIRTATLSLDDLYLPHGARLRLAAAVHPLLATRGVPGTHDVALGLAVLDSLGRPGITMVPRFDKAEDDRRPRAAWDRVDGPVDVVLFEGWCIGARSQPDTALAIPVNPLEADEDEDGRWRAFVNTALAGPYQRLFGRIDLLVLLAAPDFEIVGRWRREQEDALRIAAGPAAAGVMSPAAIDRFIRHYERLTRHILAEMPQRADLTIRLDAERRVERVDGS